VIRNCRTKKDLKKALRRQARVIRQRVRGNFNVEDVDIKFVCSRCHNYSAARLPNGDVVRGIVVGEEMFCHAHAFKAAINESKDRSLGEEQYAARLLPCNHNLEPWDETQLEQDKVPQLYMYVDTVVVPVLNLQPA